MTTISALRQSRRKSNTIRPVNRAPSAPSKVSPAMARALRDENGKCNFPLRLGWATDALTIG